MNELQNLQFNLKFVGKQFDKSSKKSEKDQKGEVLKCKKAMEKGNMEGARIYAQNAIRKKNEALNFLKLSARMDAVSSRLDTAIKMQMVTKSMGMMVKGMDKVLNAMDPERISKIMDTFEHQFETMDATAEYMETAIGSTMASTTPEDEVSSLMSQVADEHGLEIKQNIESRALSSALPKVQQVQQQGVDDETAEIEARLAKLMNAK
eukprot:TRINITY_DN28315_c0_g1_i1.p1 TRINITY_DN28315_c0_g1~~TRINITY_DN28315_c0_g1_i1.p1  ORF type:complete len:207 (+),score=44.18 TRINITY_DN28315_c0_g1_i1:3-623(+)